MTTGSIKNVGMIILMESDFNAAVDFYKKLGLKQRFELKDKWSEFDINGVKLGICPTENKVDFYIQTGIVLEVDDMMALHKRLTAEGIKFINEPKESPHGIMGSIVDPGNNVIDLYQPTPEKVEELIKKAKQQAEQEGGCGCDCSSDCENC
ncbi:MAG: hypothetical protein UR26_C0002G0168 [candidate division TM6 bacterium GW2011_GWF2_32_72]|nr:MAG: hypothetical protein UR26_C0002G0168 [candidate division TM6 bacterium GW2011_GWF2_32_72]